MKKHLLLTCAIFSMCISDANAIEGNKQLQKAKEIFVNSFEKMDVNSDNMISKDEYLSYKFEEFRANMIGANSFDDNITPESEIISTAKENIKEGVANIEKKSEEKKLNETISDNEKEENKEIKNPLETYANTLKEMAEYKLEEEITTSDGSPDGIKEFMLSTQDVMPEEISSLEELKDSENDIAENKAQEDIKDLENNPQIEDLLQGNQETLNNDDTNKKEEGNVAEKASTEIDTIINTIKDTLPKKIDEITTWVDVKYANNLISYVYKADIDRAMYTNEEFMSLQMNIKNQACEQSRNQLCEKVKPVFIDKGINLQIQYLDNTDKEITYCEFNKETCN